jgi:hypothetical protein
VSRNRYRPEVLEYWVRKRDPDPWHLWIEGVVGDDKRSSLVACQEIVNAKDRVRLVRGRWPEGACAECAAIVRQSTQRISWRDAKVVREPDAVDALFGALDPNP